jgi:hypothetical protein
MLGGSWAVCVCACVCVCVCDHVCMNSVSDKPGHEQHPIASVLGGSWSVGVYACVCIYVCLFFICFSTVRTF